MPKGTPTPIAERFWAKVNKEGPIVRDGLTPCWMWTGTLSRRGYGSLSRGRRDQGHVRATRLSWELHVGPIPDGLFVLHHCDNPPCVRPEHLFLGTQRDNITDMVSKGRRGGPTPPNVCPQGHLFDEVNTYNVPGRNHRICRACNKAVQHENYLRRKSRIRDIC